MSTPIRLRLTLSHLLVLFISMLLAGTLAWLAVEELYLETQRENLLAQASLTADALSGEEFPTKASQSYSQTTNVIPGIHTRLLSEQGATLFNLPFPSGDERVQDPPLANAGTVPFQELLNREEMQAALAGEPKTAIRRVTFSSNQRHRVLYAAAPVRGESGDVIGLVYLATPLPPSGLPPELVLRFLGAALLAAILAGVAGTFLARGIARPLENLDQAAESVSAGDLTQHVPQKSSVRELQSLGRTFNAMVDNLRQSEQVKNAFIADVTHELRTPLTVIKGTVETLEDGALDDLQGRDQLLASMHQETDRLIRLVNDLLVLTRADAKALKLDIKPLDLEALARSRCAVLAPLASKHQVKLTVAGSDTEEHAGYCVLGDADRVAQVLENLLENAIRHAPRDSTITISLQNTGCEIQCAITDRGPGIPPEHLPFVFERFYRVEASRDRQRGGAGLGLAIARSLVEAQGGHITAQSVEGQGTTITFWLPASENCHSTA